MIKLLDEADSFPDATVRDIVHTLKAETFSPP